MNYERNFYEIRPNEAIFAEIKNELQSVGYFSLPYSSIEKIKSHSEKVKQNSIVVIGIGGSSLGSKAIYQFLKNTKPFRKKLFFIDTIDPVHINSVISNLNLSDSHFVLISKSGNTLEPIAIFKFLYEKIKITHLNCTIVAGKNTSLYKFALSTKIPIFLIPENVGGRFSVFSPVGLVPLSMIGADIYGLLSGCREVHESFFNKAYYYEHIINKARFLVENKNRFVNNIIFSYSSVFSEFNKWYVQLWAESLGKINHNGTRQGLTPISLIGPEDQHSFLQLIKEGVRNKTVTFFKIENLNDHTIVPENDVFSDFGLDYINGKSFNELINLQAESTYESLIIEKDIPCDIITISEIDEKNIAKLMYRFQLLVSCIGSFLQINTYDQPGVEAGKKILKEKLSKL